MDGKDLAIKNFLSCPLCIVKRSIFFYNDNIRDYYRCSNCNLIYIPPSMYLTIEAEFAEYNKHQNSSADKGYRNFLSRLFNPLNSRLNPESLGLDFGSGPGPTLSIMFEEEGHKMNIYDPYFAPDKIVLAEQYDFITASEVVEHLHNPAYSLDLLWSLLKPGGWLGIMTKLALDKEAFSSWHYKSDPTHVCFFSKETIEWLAYRWQSKPLFFGNDVILFQKSV